MPNEQSLYILRNILEKMVKAYHKLNLNTLFAYYCRLSNDHKNLKLIITKICNGSTEYTKTGKRYQID